MPERKTKVDLPGIGSVDAIEVQVSESTERWSDVTLTDGSVLRLKPVVVSAARIENQYDQLGNPLYQLRVNQIMTVTSAPEHLRKGAPSSAKPH